YKALKVKVNSYVANYLDHGYSMSNQPARKIEELMKLILAEYPNIASKYHDGWPISDFIHLRVKYTSSHIAGQHSVRQGRDYPKNIKKALVGIDPFLLAWF
ncbi:uncharacterized protein LAESUDRAFT_648102, partial [Laetiporus sulphureus 93-53]